MDYKIRILHKEPLELTEGFDANFAIQVWNNVPILQYRPFEEWLKETLNTLTFLRRTEYIVYDSNDNIVASAAIHVYEDTDVGTAMSTLYCYSSVNGLLSKMYRYMFRLAKEYDVPTIITTKLLSNNNYSLTYHKLK